MNFKNLKIKPLLINLGICFAFPIIKAYVETNKILVFSNTCTIIGLLCLLFGIINSLVLHGDYDITSYIMHRTLNKNNKQNYDSYKKDKEEKRKDSFNYPLLCGIILIIISYLSALFV